MIDIHCHILPGVDDGSASMEESLDMCRRARADGISTVLATPHRLNGVGETAPEKIERALSELRDQTARAGIDIEILPGADVRWHEKLLERLQADTSLFLNGSGRTLLLEIPDGLVPANLEEMLFRLRLRGITPILSHPERHTVFQHTPKLLRHLVEQGNLVQVTASSITGEFGADARRVAHNWLRHGLVHFVASDAHSATVRPPVLSEARKEIENLVGLEVAEQLLVVNPGRVVNGGPITVEDCSTISRPAGGLDGHRRRRTSSSRRGGAVLTGLVQWTSVLIVVVMIVGSSLAFGGVFPVARMVLFGLGGVLAVLWMTGFLWGDVVPMKLSLPTVVFLAAGALAALQLLSGTLETGSGSAALVRVSQTFSPPATRSFLSWWALTGIVLLVTSSLHDKRRILALLGALLLLGSFQAAYGMYEQFSGHQHIFGTPRHYHLGSVTGTYVNHNHFGGLLAMLIPVALGLAASCANSWDRRRIVSWSARLRLWVSAPRTAPVTLIVFLMGLMLVAVVFSLSRGAAVGLAAGLMVTVFMLLRRRSSRLQGRAAAVVVLTVCLLSGWVGVSVGASHRLSPSHEASVASVVFRRIAWTDTLKMLRDYPILGVGSGAFETVYPLYRSAKLTGLHVSHAHNDYLEFIAERGLVGAALLIVGIPALLSFAVSAARDVKDARALAWMAGLSGGVAAIMVHSFFDFNLHIPANLMVAATLVGLLIALRWNSPVHKWSVGRSKL